MITYKKFNIVIAKRGRYKYLELCLIYLDRAAQDYDVEVTISCDDYSSPIELKYDLSRLVNLKVSFVAEKRKGNFNKSMLLNRALKNMRQDFNYLSIVDVDMLYKEDFFTMILDEVKDDKTYLISNGYKLLKNSHSRLYDGTFYTIFWHDIAKFIDPDLRHEGSNLKTYPSQITISKNLYFKILDILKTNNLYDEKFIGWGGDDSYLSFFSYDCEKTNVFKKVYMLDVWYHLWHTSTYNKELHDINKFYFEKIIKVNKVKLQEYQKRGGSNGIRVSM